MIRALLVALALTLGWGGYAYWALQSARAKVVQADARIAGLEAAARFRAADDMRRATAAALDRELQQGVGADAPLSDYLKHGAGRVWPKAGNPAR